MMQQQNDWSEEQRMDLYDFVQKKTTGKSANVTELCAEYASQKNLPLDQCQSEYLKATADATRLETLFKQLLEVAIEKSKEKTIQLQEARSMKERAFEDWENELIGTALKARPMPRAALARYLESVLPHRTWRAYSAHISRNFNNLNKNQKLDKMLEDVALREGEIVNCTVVKILEYGAICTIDNSTKKGLLHITEIVNYRVDDIEEYLFEGQKLKAMVYSDKEGRLALSTRRINSISKVLIQNERSSVRHRNKYSLPKSMDFKIGDAEPRLSQITIKDLDPFDLNGLITRAEQQLNALRKLKTILDKKEEKILQLESLRKQLTALL